MSLRRTAAALLASGALVSPAMAQESTAESQEDTDEQAEGRESNAPRQLYEPAFFDRFAPQTALEMVRQVPGFNISSQSGERGLGQGGANVLLNGTRFSAKSVSIFDALRRIPAADVTRIELVDGAALDIPGLAGQVVNLVYTSNGGSGQFRWSPEVRTRGADAVLLDGEISWSGSFGRFEYTVAFESRSNRQGNDGPELLLNGAGVPIEFREEQLFFTRDRPQFGGTLTYTGADGDVANLNAAFEYQWRRSSEVRNTAVSQRIFDDNEDELNFEIGGDYAFDLGGGRMKLIGLHRFEANDNQSGVGTEFVDNRLPSGSRQDLFLDDSETIARAEYGWTSGANDWQIALEGALNSIATANSVELLDATTGNFVPLFASPETSVSEQRAEANVTWGRPLASNVSIQASLGAEYSELSQSGQRGLTRSFFRPKGFVALSWQAEDDLDFRFQVERRVGQLNFFDFVASVDLNEGEDQAGNPNLVPEQSWLFELEATKNLGDWGALTLTGIYRSISDRVTQVPIGATGEAPGNIDGASVLFLRARGTFTFDPIGWDGVQLEVDAFARETSVPDPLTGIDRPFSGETRWQLNFDLRHDIPDTQWAYGANIRGFQNEPGVRLNQLSQFVSERGQGSVFIEHKDVAGLRVRGTVSNIFDESENFRRTVFTGRRGSPVAFTEIRQRKFGTRFTLEITGTI